MISLDCSGWGFDRAMRGVVGQMQKERTRAIASDKLDRSIGQIFSQVFTINCFNLAIDVE